MTEPLLLLAFEKSARGASLSGICLFMFLLPLLIMIMINMFKVLFSEPAIVTPNVNFDYSPEVETSSFAQVTFAVEPQHKNLTKEEQWQVIADATMEKAMSGDKSARDWVTKHIFTDPVDPSTSQSSFMQEVVDALRPMGYKAADVKSKVNELTQAREYASVDELIQDVIKNS
tara:strand:+ start:841 stop:1359 length:519 start_codon:yes stop_codon:yes gene_type:complete